jgi:hypothetical protein
MDEVDRAPHERRLDDPSLLQRDRQVIALERRQPGPEADVAGRGVLRLHAADLGDGALDGHRRTLEEQLPGEQRPVQVALREGPFGHPEMMSDQGRDR